MIRAGRLRILVADPQASAQGKRVGFGNLVRHTQQAFEAAHGLGARLCLLGRTRPLNSAVTALVSPDVETVPAAGWQHMLLGAIWRMAGPARAGGWGVWRDRLVAGAVRRSARKAMGARASLGARGRGIVKRADWAEKWARSLAHEAAKTADGQWRRRFREAGRASRTRLRGLTLEGVRVTMPDDLARRACAEADVAGIPLNAPLVALHVREAGYGRYADAHSRALDDRRNASIASYEAAARRLTAAGYTVVRIGDGSMTPVAWRGVVDLATAPYRTDLLELWCVLRSRFFIASDSGPYFLTRLANLPCLAVNVLQIGYHIARAQDRFICKRARSRATGHVLSLDEMLSDGYMAHGLDPERFDQIDNTPDDLADAVTDMLAVVEGDVMRSPAQAAYDRRLADLVTRWTQSSRNTSLVIRRHPLGSISRSFADHYFDTPAPRVAAGHAHAHHTTH